MATNPLTYAQFLKDVAEHQMHVLLDNGVYRHLRFKRPGTGCMHFDLVTYPGHLVYSGDMGNFLFERTHDMFEFFRKKPGADLDRCIDKRYWAEKIEAAERGGVKEFSEELFKRAVLGDLVAWLRGHRQETTKEERRALWETVRDEVLHVDGDSGGHRQTIAAWDFSHTVRESSWDFTGGAVTETKGLEFYFQDFCEHTLDTYTHSFRWCCFAIAWGIWQYDAAKDAQQPATTGAAAA